MKKIFSYNKFDNELANSIVDTVYALAQKSLESKNFTAEYEDANAEVNEKFMKYCVESIPGQTFSAIDMVKNPMIHKDPFFLRTFDTILAQAITPVIPTVIASGYDQLFDVTQVGYGDNASYTVESNELFIVSNLAEGILRGATQTASNAEYTVTATRHQVSCFVDWYHVAS